MKKHETSNQDELLNKLVDLQLLYTKRQQAILFEAYPLKLERLRMEKEDEIEREPLKIFRKKHDLWLERIEKLDEEIEDTFLEMELEADDLFNN